MFVPLTAPSIRQDDIDNVVRILQSGNLVQGCQVEALEAGIVDFVDVKHAVAVSNGTASLHLALLALGIGPGDEVIVPAFSYVATANVVELVGATPVFIDISLESCNLDPLLLEDAITAKTKAIIPVHEFGYPADMSAIMNIANRHVIPVVEDAACALGSEWQGQKVGSIGAVGSFSLHPRKSITSGEGGILTTNDDDLANFFRRQRNHGIQKTKTGIEFASAGFNYRLTDIQAGLVAGQLARIREIDEMRATWAAHYNRNLESGYFRKPLLPTNGKTTWQSYHLILNDEVDRDVFFSYLRGLRIEVNYGAQCIPVQRFYRDKYAYRPEQFPNAYQAYNKGAVLPLFDQMTIEQSDFVINSINDFFRTQ